MLSCLVPGAGQLYLRRWRRGTAMLLFAGLCLLAAVIVQQTRSGVPRLLLRPSFLIALLVLDVLLLAFRLSSVIDAYRIGARGASGTAGAPARPAFVAGGLALVLAATIAPHAAAGYYDLQAYDLLTSVFHRASRQPGPSASAAGEEGRPAPREPITILLIGGDAGPGRVGLRTDTMIVLSVEPATGRIVLLGLPRNFVRVPLPRGPDRAFECRCFPRPLNELYAYAHEHPEQFPGEGNPGVRALQGAVEELLGISIDYHALVELKGFIDVVDALGGVTIRTTEPIHIEIDRLDEGRGGPAFNLQPGRHHLNGQTALAYVRSRKTTSDYDRMRRQRCLLGALARQADASRVLRAFPRLVRTAKRDISTDIPLDQLPALIDVAGQQRPEIEAIGFIPPDYISGWASGGYPVPDVKRIQRATRVALREPGALAEQARQAPAQAPGTRVTSGSAPPARADSKRPKQLQDPCRPAD